MAPHRADPLAMSDVRDTDPPQAQAQPQEQRPLTTDEQIFQMVASIRSLTTTVNNLAQSVATLTGATGSITGHTRPINIVEKPKAFEGKSSEQARLFRSSFMVWVQDHEAAFAKRDEYGHVITDDDGNTRYNGRKMITSALSFMTGNAAIWARPHLEKVANGEDVFALREWSKEVGRY